MIRALVLALGALIVSAGTAHAAPVPFIAGPFVPRDDCLAQPGGRAFRLALGKAIRARDTAAFLALTNPNITLDFGGGHGRADLQRRLRGAEGRKLWGQLDALLPLGCAVQEGNLVMPHFFANFGDNDPFTTMLVTGAMVPLRARPSAKSRTLRLLSWTLVEPLRSDDFSKPWRQVKALPSGPTGYVTGARLRRPVDYRLIASRKGGVWRIDSFLAGD